LIMNYSERIMRYRELIKRVSNEQDIT